MTTKKTKTETKKVQPQDSVAEWKERLEEIAKERRGNAEHREKIEKELRRLVANRKSHETHIKEKAAQEFHAQKEKSSGALLDSLYRMDKGKIPESVQLELNIMALQGALSECHAETKRLEAEENQLVKRIKDHAVIEGIHAFYKAKENFEKCYLALRESHDELISIAQRNGQLDQGWINRLHKVDTPKELKPGTGLDSIFIQMFESGNLPYRTLLSSLERLRGFQDSLGKNIFADAPPQTEQSPNNLVRDSLIGGGPTRIDRQDAKLKQVVDRAIAGF